ncbi:Uncharacterized protein TCM_011009 isoform 2, partial [Theobroma cacao]
VSSLQNPFSNLNIHQASPCTPQTTQSHHLFSRNRLQQPMFRSVLQQTSHIILLQVTRSLLPIIFLSLRGRCLGRQDSVTAALMFQIVASHVGVLASLLARLLRSSMKDQLLAEQVEPSTDYFIGSRGVLAILMLLSLQDEEPIHAGGKSLRGLLHSFFL